MRKYSNYEKLVFKKVELCDKATLNFKDGDYTFPITNSKWRASHTSRIDYKAANKEKIRAIQILKRTLPKAERQEFKYFAVPEFNKSGRLWQLRWHVIANKNINYSKIDKTGGELKAEIIRSINSIAGYFCKYLYISMGSDLGHFIKPFSYSHNVLNEGDLAYNIHISELLN
ncbi:MAG: hypothetical protein AM1032_000379 [Mycoplasmataceae bacterium]|nr:MAG: hypothetical protein AM1032_000379 [Mycoplasmataceae bacterium]